MKRLLLLLICFLPLQLLAENPIDDDCTFNGIPLRGKVYVYDTFGLADVNIAVVLEGAEDLRVNLKSCCAEECGEWELIENPALADFTICIVQIGVEDFLIAYSPINGLR